MPSARVRFIVCALVAAPGLLWQAFEMYGLTLGGPQMLFFSIVHTMPVAVLVVLLAIPFALALLGQAIASFFLEGYRLKVGLTKNAAGALSLFLAFHALALLAYEAWSSSILRIPVCILGLGLFAIAAVYTLIALGNPHPPHPREALPLHRADVPRAASRPLARRSCRTVGPTKPRWSAITSSIGFSWPSRSFA